MPWNNIIRSRLLRSLREGDQLNLEMEKITHSTNEILDIISDMFEDMTDEQEHKLRREIWNRLNDMSMWGYDIGRGQ